MTSGKILIDNIDIKKINLSSLDPMGYVPQDGYLLEQLKTILSFSVTIIIMTKWLRTKYAEILDEINSFKDGFNTLVGEEVFNLRWTKTELSILEFL